MAEFSICERYTKFWISQTGFWICLDRVLNISWVLNMPGFWICLSSEYLKVTQGSKHAKICWICLNRTWICLNRTWIYLNMSEFTIIDRILNIYSARSLYKLMSAYYWAVGVFSNIVVVFNNFCKKLRLKSL